MPKTTATQRQRRQRALASFLIEPYIDGKFCEFRGDPREAPKRWKRLWRRQAAYVQGVSASNLRRLQAVGQRTQAQQKGSGA